MDATGFIFSRLTGSEKVYYGRTWAFEPDDYLAKLKPTREKTPWGTEYDRYMEEET